MKGAFVAAHGLSLVAASCGCSLVACRPLVVLAALVERRLSCAWASVVVAHVPGSCDTWAPLLHGMWDCPRPGIELVPLALRGGFLATGPPGKPQGSIFKGKVREGYGRICDRLEHNSVAAGQVTGWYHMD